MLARGERAWAWPLWCLAATAAVGAASKEGWSGSLSAFTGSPDPGRHTLDHWTGAGAGLLRTVLLLMLARQWGRSGAAWTAARGRTGFAGPAVMLAGLALVASASLALGLCGLFFPPVAAAFMLAGAVAAVRWARRPRRFPGPGLGWRAILLPAACLVPAVMPLLLALRPETWVDSLAYHVAAPADFVQRHKWFDTDQNTYRYPLLAQAVCAQGFLLGSRYDGTWLNLMGAVLLGEAVRRFAAGLAGRLAGWLAVAGLAASSQIGWHLGSINQGFYSSAFAFTAVITWIGAVRGRGSPLLMSAAGAMLGWAACAKYTAAAPAAGIFAWHLVRGVGRPGREAVRIAWLIAGAAVAAGPFLMKGWLFTANPVYPLFFGGLRWTEANTELLRLYGCPGYGFAPDRAAGVLRFVRDVFVREQPLVLLALPAIAALRFAGGRPFLFAWGGAVLVWASAAPCVRFMLPFYGVAAGLAGAGLARMTSRPGPAVTRAATIAVVLAGSAHAFATADWNRRSVWAALGLEPKAAYLQRILTTYHEAVAEVSRRVPGRERVLVVGEIRGFRFLPLTVHRDVVDTPEMLEIASRCRDAAHIARKMRQRGYRYLVHNYVTGEYLGTFRYQVMRWKPSEVARLYEYWRRHARVRWRQEGRDATNGGFMLYELAERPEAPLPHVAFLPGTAGLAGRIAGDSDADWENRLRWLHRVAPGVLQFRIRLAYRLLAADRSREALALIEPARGADTPETAALHAVRGVALAQEGHLWESVRAMKKAIALDPREGEYRRFLSRVEAKLAGG